MSEHVDNSNFIEQIIDSQIKEKSLEIHTRFPPEPNGFLHIGHAKAFWLNYEIALKYNGKFNLRFDDTNPEKESDVFVKAIIEDIKWLGVNFDNPKNNIFFASDYFDKFYVWALELINKGLAYVDESSPEELKEQRGTPTKAGTNSKYRNRSINENLELLKKMNSGEMRESSAVLRAKIDMSHPNLSMRDPIMYRIKKIPHHRAGNKWNIYPMYDFAHGYEDLIEGISHSLCSLEFENNRPLYNWFLENIETYNRPQQIEFARLNLSYTFMSKRLLKNLIDTNIVDNWDDPRMPTIAALRKRGYTPHSIRRFCKEIGVAKSNSLVDIEFFDYIQREEFNQSAHREMVVIDPIKLVIENYPDDKQEDFYVENIPGNESAGKHKVVFTKELYIERDDFMEQPPKKYFRLSIGKEVRLKYAYYVTCTSIEKDSVGNIIQINCTYDPETRGGDSKDKRKVKGTIHWLSLKSALDIEVRHYEHLFLKENPADISEDENLMDYINTNSMMSYKEAKANPGIIERAKNTISFQFLRKGYYKYDENDDLFHRTLKLKDSWKKIENPK